MKILGIESLALPEVKVIRYARFCDDRGYFTETYRKSDFFESTEMDFFTGLEFFQMNESRSKRGVIRGLHFQWNPFMGKLVRTIHGHMYDLFADIRPDSPNFGKICFYDMPTTGDEPFGEWIWVPPGFAHGNVYLEDSRIEYLCSGWYSPECELGISPRSQDLDFSPCGAQAEHLRSLLHSPDAMLSDKDCAGISIAEWAAHSASSMFLRENLTGR